MECRCDLGRGQAPHGSMRADSIGRRSGQSRPDALRALRRLDWSSGHDLAPRPSTSETSAMPDPSLAPSRHRDPQRRQAARNSATCCSLSAMEVLSAGELGLPEPEETGSTFVENAEIKAAAAARAAELAGTGRRLGSLRRRARRRPRSVFGALGRAGQGLRRRHGADRAAARGVRARVSPERRRAHFVAALVAGLARRPSGDGSKARFSAGSFTRPVGTKASAMIRCSNPMDTSARSAR